MYRDIDKENGWIIREIIEPGANERHTHYFYRKKRAPRIELNSILAQQLAGYVLIEKDLRNVMIWLDEVERIYPQEERPKESIISPDRERFNIIKALTVAALSFYGKSFSKCDGRRAQLHRKNINEEFREAHDDVMRRRHHFAAHSGADKFEEVRIALVLYPSKKSDDLPEVFKELTQPDLWDDTSVDITFPNLVKHVRGMVMEKMHKLEKRLLYDEILSHGKEYWYKKAKK